nr:auxin response factor 2-like isoform X2 [Ipomoea trifida]
MEAIEIKRRDANLILTLAVRLLIIQAARTSPDEFIIPYDLESLKNNYIIGMRFKMRFEGEEAPEQRFIGTIVGIEDCDPHK